MRALPIIVIALSSGLALGAGMSWFSTAGTPTALPKPIHGKGPHFMLERPPAEVASLDGGWSGDDRLISHGVRITRGSSHSNVATAEIAEGVYYKGCSEVRADGKAPLYRGQPGYREGMDGDGDGIACEDYGPGSL